MLNEQYKRTKKRSNDARVYALYTAGHLIIALFFSPVCKYSSYVKCTCETLSQFLSFIK